MSRPQYILLPANPVFIGMTLLVAFLLNVQAWGRTVGVPDFVALALVFWAMISFMLWSSFSASESVYCSVSVVATT